MMKSLLVTVAVVVGLRCVVVAGQPGMPPSVFTAAQAAAGRTAYESVVDFTGAVRLLRQTGEDL